MSIINNGLLLASGADAAVGYQISRSLRFSSGDSSYLGRTPASAGNRTTWTFSTWVKRSKLGVIQRFFSGATATNDDDWMALLFNASDQLVIGGYNVFFRTSNSVYRDCSAWYHIVVIADLGNGSNSLKLRAWVNNQEVTWSSTSTNPTTTGINSANNHAIGAERGPNNGGVGSYFDGYLADIYFLDGTATTPSTFAETDAVTGQWVPKTPTGISYGTNGFRLTFSDNSGTTSTTLGKDAAGSNNWTPNNFSVASGSGNDSLVDSPSSYGTDTGAGGEVRGNYCTFNPLFALASLTLTNGNLETSSPGAAWRNAKGTFAMTTGKWYWEHTVPTTGAADGYIGGVATATADYSSSSTGIWGRQGTTKYSNGSSSTPFGSTTSGDILGFAFDADAGKLWVAQNGTWVGDPGAGTGESWSGIPSGVFPYVAAYNQANIVNFGQRAFAYTNNRSGFKALCDTNLTSPTIALPNTVMDVKLYTGNGSTQTISGLGFSPDFVWIKDRSQGNGHGLFDVIRGVTKGLFSNLTNAEITDSNSLTSFDSTGFSTGSGGTTFSTNINGNSYVAWTWDAGTSTVTNTQGSITSSVRANTSSGFSVLTATTPTSGSSFSVGHGLGVAPAFAIFKDRGYANSWGIYHKSITTTTGGELLFTTAAAQNYGWFPSAPTSTTFTLSVGGWGTGASIVGYLWTPVAGYSSMGSFVGSSDLPFIYTGFKPRWLLLKNAGASGDDWALLDSARNTYNELNSKLWPNTSAAEATLSGNNSVDFLANGFKMRSTNNATNSVGNTMIYACFAESPFQYARAR